MKTTHSPVFGRLLQSALVAVFTGVVSGPAEAQGIRGELVNLVNPYTLVIDVKGTEQNIVGNAPGSPGIRATLDCPNLHEIAATDFRPELGDKPVDS